MANYYETVVRLEQQLGADLDNTCKLQDRSGLRNTACFKQLTVGS
jgi:hypothetical protein